MISRTLPAKKSQKWAAMVGTAASISSIRGPKRRLTGRANGETSTIARRYPASGRLISTLSDAHGKGLYAARV